MANMPWFRFYSETLNDRKIKRICSATGQPKALIVGVWVTILALANDSPKRGKLMISDDLCLTTEEILEETGLSEEPFSLILVELVTLGMIELDGDCWTVCNWDGRQFKSDHSSLRVAKHRADKKRQEEEQAEQEGNASEQLQEQSDGVIDTETKLDIESEKETEPEADQSSFVQIRTAWIDLFPEKPKPRLKNKTLRGKVSTRMKDELFEATWYRALVRASRSDFCNSGGWFTLGWFLKNKTNWEKCLDGNYDNRAQAGSQTPTRYLPEGYETPEVETKEVAPAKIAWSGVLENLEAFIPATIISERFKTMMPFSLEDGRLRVLASKADAAWAEGQLASHLKRAAALVGVEVAIVVGEAAEMPQLKGETEAR